MDKFSIIFILFLVWITEGFASVEDDYIKKLVGDSTENGYKLDMLPPTRRRVHNFTQEPVMVDIRLIISSINELNLAQQSFSLSAYLCMYWNDSRLEWHPDVSPRHGQGGDGPTTVNIAPTHIWTPNIALVNTYEAGYNTNIEKVKKASLVTVSSNGMADWCPQVHLKTFCTIDVTYYPWDQQTCVLKFISTDFNGNQFQLSFHNKAASSDLSEMYLSVYFDVIEAPAYLNFYPDATGTHAQMEHDATFYITLKRRSGGLSHALWLTISLNTLTLVSILTLVLPSKGERSLLVAISAIGVLLIFYHVMETLPPTSLVIPVIVKYILFLLGVILTAFIGNLVSANISRGTNLLGKVNKEEANLERRLKIGNICDIVIFLGLGVVWMCGNLWFLVAAFPY